MTTIFAMLFSVSIMGACAHQSDELTFRPADAIVLTLSSPPAEPALESAADIEDVYPAVIKDPRRKRAPRRNPPRKKAWVPEKVPASTYLHVRPAAPMMYGNLR